MNPWLLFWISAGLALLGAMPRLMQEPDEADSGQGLRRVHMHISQHRVKTEHATGHATLDMPSSGHGSTSAQ